MAAANPVLRVSLGLKNRPWLREMGCDGERAGLKGLEGAIMTWLGTYHSNGGTSARHVNCRESPATKLHSGCPNTSKAWDVEPFVKVRCLQRYE